MPLSELPEQADETLAEIVLHGPIGAPVKPTPPGPLSQLPRQVREAMAVFAEARYRNLTPESLPEPDPAPVTRADVDATLARIALHGPHAKPGVMDLSEELEEWHRWAYYTSTYGWSIPTREALDAIVAFVGTERVLDVGAGAGLWAALLRAAGLDVTATDKEPGPAIANYKGRPITKRRLWTEIEACDATAAVQKYRHPVLFLSRPSNGAEWPAEALSAFTGSKVVFVGHYDGRIFATPRFFELLDAGWAVQRRIALPQWRWWTEPAQQEAGWLFTRPTTPGERPVNYYHGGVAGLEPGQVLLPPAAGGQERRPLSFFFRKTTDPARSARRDRVYITTELDAAALFAKGCAGGSVYRVEPVGPLEPDPSAQACFTVSSAKVLAVEQRDLHVTLADLSLRELVDELKKYDPETLKYVSLADFVDNFAARLKSG